MSKPELIVNKMMENDLFSQWMGIEIVEVSLGTCTLQMSVREEMCNGFGVCHGGVQFSLADSALAFSCNSHGMKTMSIEASISHFMTVHAGDLLTAKSEEVSKKNKISTYLIDIHNQKDELVSQFKGMVYHSSKPWE